MILTYVLVAVGGAVGSVLRVGAAELVARFVNNTFPWATILVNVIGSLLIGYLAHLVSPLTRVDSDTRAFTLHFLILGFCGGFTTFSSFSLQTFTQLQHRQYLAAGANVLLSMLLCLGAVALGHWFGTLVHAPRVR